MSDAACAGWDGVRRRRMGPSSPLVLTKGGMQWQMPTSRRFGAGAEVCSFGSRATGGDDARHCFFCRVMSATLASRPIWRRPA